MSLFKLTIKSILNRRLTTLLVIVSIGLSSMLLIGVQKIKHSAKESFSRSISGTDLIVGARSGEVQLLLYSIFRQGQAVANMSWTSAKEIEAFSEVEWMIPFSLGDSHQGYPLLGTTTHYFDHYKYGRRKPLKLQKGHIFQETFEVVLGAEVAKKLNYKLGDELFISHGMAKGNLPLHKQNAFKVVGILKETGTPIDKTLHVPLEGIIALHSRPLTKKGRVDKIQTTKDGVRNQQELKPEYITSCLVGLKSKFSLFTVQRRLANWESEALMAIIPGVALARLWNSISVIDHTFLIMTILVTAITFIGLLIALFTSLQQRKYELAILRTMGARPLQLAMILIMESIVITGCGVIVGLVSMRLLGYILTPVLENKLGLIVTMSSVSLVEIYIAIGIVLCGVITSFIPAVLAYRKSITEGFISI
ncbi:MAG: ABC transporter permease [bacterium]